jgi:sugar-specific transcriptional regulator TrmB
LISSRGKELLLIERLQALGLTPNESKVYLSILRLGFSGVTAVADAAKLHRPEVYRVIPRLMEMGLVEERLDRPQRYRVKDVKDAVTNLVEAAITRYKGIVGERQVLVAQLETIQGKLGTEEGDQIRYVAGADNIRRQFRDVLNGAQHEVWIISREMSGTRSNVNYLLEKIASKNLKARIVVNVEEENINHARRLASAAEVRHFHPLFGHLYGVDQSLVAVGLEPGGQIAPDKYSQLVTTNSNHVKALREFFEFRWESAVPLASRIAALQSKEGPAEQTRIIWGREAIHNETSGWHLRAKRGIIEITTQNGPVRLWGRFQKAFTEAQERNVRWRLICHVSPENREAVQKLSTVADVRLVERPFGIGIVVLDNTEAMIHYIDPDSADLKDSQTDLALVTADPAVALNTYRMLNSIWKLAKPLKTRRQP